MSQHKHKSKNILSFIFVSLAVAFALAGCRDELLYSTTEIPDAVVDVEGEVIFRPLVKTEITTRAADAPSGNIYEEIKTLHVFFFDKETGAPLSAYNDGPVTFVKIPNESSTHQRVKFKKQVQAGEYYVFAVANIAADQKAALENIASIEDLKNFKLKWDVAIEKNLEMFGVFKLTGSDTEPEDVKNDGFEDYSPIIITPQTNKIHSWVRRAASKVTVNFDGSGLMDGVQVKIKSATLKDVPLHASLGVNSKVGDDISASEKIVCAPSYDFEIKYGDNTIITNETEPDASLHEESASALPCYENMQGIHGEKTKYQDKDGDGIIDSVEKDGIEGGTYLEVVGYYKSDRPEYKSEGDIIYRFMLGQNAENDFNLRRNHHYKITMKFKDYGSDIDWHVDYRERYLDLTYPQDVNYQGKFFQPSILDGNSGIEGDLGSSWFADNAGHNFSKDNTITLTSYESFGNLNSNKWIGPTSITYGYKIYNDVTGEWETDAEANGAGKGWLSCDSIAVDNTQKKYIFKAAMATPKSETINAGLQKATAVANYDLSQGGETANCYIVNAPGTYSFPLVYGNGNVGGENFRNHLGEKITNKDILASLNGKVAANNLEARIIWQDAQGLVSNVNIDGGKITFSVDKGTIKEGNAVIALVDKSKPTSNDMIITDSNAPADKKNQPYVQGENSHAIWSWHIWVTRFGSDDFEKNIQLTAHDETKYDVLPVNLGWCAGDNPVVYFPRRKCDITFTVQGKEIERTIEQYPHFALPRGDNPYYQWGRKDPFVGTLESWHSKDRWDNSGTKISENPDRIFSELPTDPDTGFPRIPEGAGSDWLYSEYRLTTQDCLKELIKNPDKWHNAPRLACDPDDAEWHKNGFYSNNKSFDDLWGYNGEKSIYDPCPPGYRVESENVFSGFTVSGRNESVGKKWYDVLEGNMYDKYNYTESKNANVIEFYTNPRKLQSIAIPITGYRDYDERGEVYNYGLSKDATGKTEIGIGFLWTNRAREVGKHTHYHWSKKSGQRYTVAVDGTCSYHLKVQRKDGENDWMSRGVLVAPREEFYDTDGFAVRPVKIKK